MLCIIKGGKQDLHFVSGLLVGMSKLNGVTHILIPQQGKTQNSLDSRVWKAVKMDAAVC